MSEEVTVRLTGRTLQLAEEMVASGNASDVEHAVERAFAVASWKDAEDKDYLDSLPQEFWDDVNRKIDEGIADLDAGNWVPFTPELFEDIKRRGRERLRATERG